jgi:hypothetical protein
MAVPRARVPSEGESLADLVQRLRADVTRILETELRLFRVRAQTGLEAVRAAGMGLVAAAVLVLEGVGAIIAGFVLLLATVIPVWIAAFAVGGALLVIAGIVIAAEVHVVRHGVREAMAPVDGLPSPQLTSASSETAYGR